MASLFQKVGHWFSPTRFPPPPGEDATHPMKAIVVKCHGPPEIMEYTDFPSPVPPIGSRQVLVDIVAAGVNPVDFKLRKEPVRAFAYPLPKIVGQDMAGIVSWVPPGSQFYVGQKVYALLPVLSTQFGSYAQKCCVEESTLVPAPENFSLIDLASIPLVGTTIVQALKPVRHAFPGEAIRGKKVFIPCGSGGLGTFAVQYCAKELGMFVVSSTSAQNMEFVRSLGANEVFDYKVDKMENKIKDFDVILDSMGYQNEELVLKEGSTILRHGSKENPSFYVRIASSPYSKPDEGTHFSSDPLSLGIPETRIDRLANSYSKQFFSSYGYMVPNGISYHFILVYPDKEALADVTSAIIKGTVKPIIQERIPIEEAARAHHIIEEGHVRGKLVLVVNHQYEKEQNELKKP